MNPLESLALLLADVNGRLLTAQRANRELEKALAEAGDALTDLEKALAERDERIAQLEGEKPAAKRARPRRTKASTS